MRQIKFFPEGGVFIAHGDSHYMEPYNAKYYVEAVTVLDALIDSWLLQLALVYSKKGLKPRNSKGRPYSGLRFARMLVRKKVVEPELLGDVIDFKGKRNLMVHRVEGEFALILHNKNAPRFWSTCPRGVRESLGQLEVNHQWRLVEGRWEN